MHPFRFVHAADLHLDSAFKGLAAQSPAVAEILRTATFDAYGALIRLCLERDAKFLVVAGDVYDGADRSLRAQLRFRDGLAELARRGIPSFVAHGNHDPLGGWSSAIEWPGEAHIFGAEKVGVETVCLEGTPVAAIAGISHGGRDEKRNLSRLFHSGNAELFQVGVLHCNCGGDTGHEPYAPCTVEDLASARFNYWALGHVHKRAILNREPYIAYPGNTQGRHINEPGACGCYVVTVGEGHRVEVEFVPLDAVRWLTARVEIGGLESIDALERAIARALDEVRLKAEGRPAVCRLCLAGRGPLYKDLSRERALADLLARVRETAAEEPPLVWVQAIEPDCRPEMDLERRAEEADLLGEVLRVARELRADGPIAGAIQPALATLFADPRIERNRALEALGDEEVARLLEEAELLCADLLETD